MSANPVGNDNNVENTIVETTKPDYALGGSNKPRFHYNPSEAPSFSDEDEHLFTPPSSDTQRIATKRPLWFRLAQGFGVIASLSWGFICITYLMMQGGIATQTPYELGIFAAGMLAPVAFYWMLLSYLQRNNDVKFYAENLRSEMHALFFPSEEESKHVNKDIERMTQQAAEFAASSRAALKSIQRTRQGLRHEIKEFASFAGKAESHLIALSNNLTEKTKETNDLIQVMDERVELITHKADRSVDLWNEAAAQMIERSGDIEGVMNDGAQRILDMAEIAQEKSHVVSDIFDGTVTSLGLTVDAVIDRLGSINEEFGAYTRTLSISAEDLSKETSRMEGMIVDHVDQLQNASGRSVEQITQSLVQVSDERDRLDETISILSTKASDMANAISNSVEGVNQSADEIVSRAEKTADTIAEKTTLLSASLNGLEEQIDRIDSTSEMAQHRLGEGIESAIHGSTQISDAIRRGVETLTKASGDATTEATSIIETTLDHIKLLKETGQGNVLSVERMVELLEQSRQQIEKASHCSQTHVEDLTKAVDDQTHKLGVSAASLADEVRNVTRALDEPLRMVGLAIADADGRHEQIQKTLENRITDLKEVSGVASQSVDLIRQGLKEQTNDLSSLSGRLTAQSRSLNAELTTNKELLSETIDTTVSNMNRLMDTISDKSEKIALSSDSLVEMTDDINQKLETTLSNTKDIAESTHQFVEKTQNELLGVASSFENKVETSGDALLKLHSDITHTCDLITPVYDRLETGSNKAIQSLNDMKEQYELVSELAHSKLEKTGYELDKRLSQLEKGTEHVSVILKETGDDLREKIDTIEFAASNANTKMNNLANSMESQTSNMHIVADQAVLKIETIQKILNGQFHELSESVGQAVSEIENAGLSFENKAQRILGQSNDVLDSFSTIGEDVSVKAYELKQASHNIADVARNTVDEITNQMNVLEENSENSLTNLRKTSETLSIKSKEVNAMMQANLSQAQSYTDDMRQQIKNIAEQSDRTAGEVGQSITTLLGTMDSVNNKTKTVVNYISETNQSLYDQSGRFVTAVAKSAQAAEQATDMFSQSSNDLLKAAHVALEKTKEIKDTELRVSRETFLSSARFVLESLHSLSIDFVRMIDGDVSEKDWASYQKGDVAIFTSNLVKRLDDLPTDKIREKYASDSEFRNYVQKFIRQFDDVLEQTDSVDRGAVLGTTFAASDVGKIYRYLVSISRRN